MPALTFLLFPLLAVVKVITALLGLVAVAGFYWIVPLTRERCWRVRLGYKIDPTHNEPSSAAFSFLVNPWANFGK